MLLCSAVILQTYLAYQVMTLAKSRLKGDGIGPTLMQHIELWKLCWSQSKRTTEARLKITKRAIDREWYSLLETMKTESIES
jgi:hypothetical protein